MLPHARPLAFTATLISLLPIMAAGQDTIESSSAELGAPISVADVPIRVERITVSDGLSQGAVYQILQDRRGFMWFVTQDGLNRFDGHHFKVYQSVPFEPNSLSDDWVWSIAEDSEGMLWVGTQNGGLNRLDPHTDRVTRYAPDPDAPGSIPDGGVVAVTVDDSGNVWTGVWSRLNGNGLCRMHPSVGSFTCFTNDPINPRSITNNLVSYLFIDRDRDLWVSTKNGLNRMSLDAPGRFDRFIYRPGDPSMESQDLRFSIASVTEREHEPGVLWVGTMAGLVRLDETSGDTRRYDLDPDNPNENLVSGVIEDPSSSDFLWVTGLGGGLGRFHVPTASFIRYKHNPGDASTVSDDLLASLYADRGGSIWVGSFAGYAINRFDPSALGVAHFKHNPENSNSLGGITAWGIGETSDGYLWVGTVDDNSAIHLNRIDRRTGSITRYLNTPGGPAGLTGGFIFQIHEDRHGTLWIGEIFSNLYPESGGLSRKPRGARSFERIQSHPNDPRSIGPGSVYDIHEDPDGTMWFGHGGSGVSRMSEDGSSFVRYVHDPSDPMSLSSNNVRDIYRDRTGTLWIGTVNGLNRMDEIDGRFTRFMHDQDDPSTISGLWITSVVDREQEPGVLWIGTSGGGLNRFDPETESFAHLTSADGLPNDNIYGILVDDQGLLWMSSNRGIIRFDPDTGAFQSLGVDDGLQSLEFNEDSFYRSVSGELFFGGMNGLNAFFPNQIRANPVAPSVVLTDLHLFSEPVAVGPDGPLHAPLNETDEIRLAHDQNNVTIEFVALHFADPEHNQYLYRLEGFDEEWIDPGDDRSATYTNLAPGDYVFRVKASNADGVWNEEGASLRVVVRPPWWRTIWAYGLYVVLIGGAFYGFDRVQRARLIRKERERAQIEQAELRAEAAESETRALQAENERKRNVELLSGIGRQITGSLSVDEIIDTVYARVNELMDAAVFGIGLVDEKGEALLFPATREKGERLEPYHQRLDDALRLAAWCFNNQEEVVVSDYTTEYDRYVADMPAPVAGADASSILYLPLVSKDRVIGVITAQSFSKQAYTEYHLNLLRNLATYTAIALDKAEAYSRLEATLEHLKATQEQLVTQEKLASLGALTAGIAHEIKNPLNFINNFADLSAELADEVAEAVERGAPPEEIAGVLDDLRANAAQIGRHGRRADTIVRNMMAHAQGGSNERKPVDINELVREYVDLAYHGKRSQGLTFNCRIDFDLAPDLPDVPVVAQDIGRVVLNLVGNAFDAVEERLERDGEGYTPTVRLVTRQVDGDVEILVSDNGPGIPEDLARRVFEPFFTTKSTGAGTGLGLSLSHDIVSKVHSGRLAIGDTGPDGTTFVMRIGIDILS